MTRARRVHLGERTQSEAGTIHDPVLTDVKIGPSSDEPRHGLEVSEGQEGTISNEPLAKRFCKRCEASAANTTISRHADGSVYGFTSPLSVVVAGTGTAHLDAGEGLTLCGLEHGDW